jgi:two-component system alkaline phosphatase synthesis response regulator PhoP
MHAESQKLVLIIEDEERMVEGLRINLEARGFRVSIACDGEEGYQKAMHEQPDLVLLDLMLPKLDGYEICRRLKQETPELPIIILTARSQEAEVVLGLELGADDYVTKPFSILELLARIQAVLRRVQPTQEDPVSCEFGDVRVDFQAYQATKRGNPIELSPREFEILKHLVRFRGLTVSRDELLNAVWGYDCFSSPRTIDTHIAKLRLKVEDNPPEPKYIITVHGHGYKLLS